MFRIGEIFLSMMRGGPLLFWWVLFLVGAKLSLASTLAWSLGKFPQDNLRLVNDYPTVNLTTVGISCARYRDFVAELRTRLQSGKDSYGIPLLHSRDMVSDSERFILVDLSNEAGLTATLALDVINVYVVGYRAGDYSIFFSDAEDAIPHLFAGTQPSALGFTGSYTDLQRAADRSRDEIELGTAALEESISAMYRYANNQDRNVRALARAFMVAIQMVSEAARFRFIELEMKRRIGRNVVYVPHASITELENNWGGLSRAIQESNQGMFDRPIQLVSYTTGMPFEVDNVQTIAAQIGLLLFVCTPPPSSHPDDHLLLVRRLIVMSESTCPPYPEPRLQIMGAGGLCVDVRGGKYHNGNPVILWPCKSSSSSSSNENQLWTFTRDGTIRSNKFCMAASNSSSIMIHDCDPPSSADAPPMSWQVWVDGTIMLASSGDRLVLSTNSSASGTLLSVRDNTYTTGQSWLPTNSTAVPPAKPILGPFGLCLQENSNGGQDDDVLLRECTADDADADQAWALYPDGSIRPQQRRNSCLAAPEHDQAAADDLPPKIIGCDPNSSLQRWLFPNDGTIINPGSGLVMDVRGSVKSGFHIILNHPTGRETQQWQPLL